MLQFMNGAKLSDFNLSIGRHFGYTGALGLATKTVNIA
jgi:hypothetical protein